MKYLGAYMLATLGGNAAPDAAAIKKILEAVGAEYEESVLTKVLAELSGKNVMEVIEQGKSKLSSVPSGGAAAGGAAGGAAPAAEVPKEEEKEESEEEEEEDMDFDLFD